MKLQQMLSRMRKADEEYKMISKGDHVIVGLSGGKDSLAMLTVLSHYKKYIRRDFELSAVTIDMVFADVKKEEVEAQKKYVADLDVPLYIEKTDIAEIIFNDRKEENPCSLCSKMRRGALNTKAVELGGNKVALGHNLDDLVETFWLSFFYEGRLSTFAPISYLDRTDISIIRPLLYVKEREIKWFSKDMPIVHNPCPANKKTQREVVKQMIYNLDDEIKGSMDRMFHAIVSPERYNLFDKYEKHTKGENKNKDN